VGTANIFGCIPNGGLSLLLVIIPPHWQRFFWCELAYKIAGAQDLKHSDLYSSHSIIASFFFASHSALSIREQSTVLGGHSIFKQSRHGSPQPAGDNAIKTSVTITFKTRGREVKTKALPPLETKRGILAYSSRIAACGHKWNSINANQVAPGAASRLCRGE
jgi:hypothetical protein